MSIVTRRSNSRRTVAYAAGTPWMPRASEAPKTEARAPAERTLATLLAEGSMPLAEARRIGESVARELAKSHAVGRVLGNLTPRKIALRSRDGVDHVELLARAAGSSAHEPEAPASRYVAPEQVQCHGVSAACDVYTLGVILFEMVAGRAPIHGRTSMELMVRKTIEDAPPLVTVCPDVTPSFAVLVDACLARDPERRPSSAAEVAARLVEDARPRATVELSSQPRRGATVVVASRPLRRVRPDIAALVVAFGVALAALAYALMEDDTGSPWGERVRGNLLSPVEDPAAPIEDAGP